MKHITTMKNMSTDTMLHILNEAKKWKNGEKQEKYPTTFACNLFFEASTRTKLSFEVAERKLGMHVLPFDVANSSVQKGETLLDTVKTIEALGVEVVVIRSDVENYYEELLEHTNVKLLNAGDGSGQHPSQSLLDLFTIQEEFGKFEGLNIVIAGDIAHSRVARSNAVALKALGANVTFLSPPQWSGEFECVTSWDGVLETANVIMLLRVQNERHNAGESYSKEEYLQQYGLTFERYEKMKESAIIMHPAPINRGVEIESELVESDKSRIFKQMENGVFIRMAMLEYVLQEEK